MSEKIVDNFKREFDSADLLIEGIVRKEEIEAVCPGTLEINEKSPWKIIIIGLLVVIVFAALGLDPNLINLIFLPFVIYAFYKGFRARPECIVITESDVWLISHVIYSRNTKKFSYEYALRLQRDKIRPGFYFGFFSFKIKAPGGISAIMKQGYFLKLKKYYRYKVVGIKTAKAMLL